MKQRRTTAGTMLLLLSFAEWMAALPAQITLRPEHINRKAEVISAAQFSGPDWLAKVNAAAASLVKGGTIEVPDSIAGAAMTTGVIPSNVSLEFTGSATFGLCQINVGQFSKLYNRDALLQIAKSDCIGINQPNSASLQQTDKFILDGVRMDCNHQPNSTGVFVGSGHAQTSMRNVTIVNCSTAGLTLDGGQFGEYSNLSVYNNFVGLKISTTPKGGGGNSNTFYGLKAVGNTVGVLIAETSNFGMGADYFVNPSLLNNSVAGMAVFGNKWKTDVHWYGGAPEDNGRGAAEVTVDHHVVKRASIYLNRACLYLTELSIGEAKVTPFVRAENLSSVVMHNVSGYGRWDGTLVSADSTSTTSLEGRLDVLGTIENVVSYPSALKTSGYVRMFGSPLISTNEHIPNAFLGNARTPRAADVNGAVSSRTDADALMGPVTSVVHAPVRGTQERNRANFGNVISASSTGEHEVLLSILLKSTVTCGYTLGAYGDGYSNVSVPLIAGRWTRVVLAYVSSKKGLTLVGWPNDSSGPAISYTGLQVLVEPQGSTESEGYMSTMLTTGAVRSNGPHP